MPLPEFYKRHELAIAAVVTLVTSASGIFYLMSRPQVAFYSFNEIARATEACSGKVDLEMHRCMVKELTEWRKSAPAEAPRGSR